MINIVVTDVNKLKYLSIQLFILLPYLYINKANKRYLIPRLKVDANKNIRIGTMAAPAAMVNTLNGIGVNPAVKIVKNVFDLNDSDSSIKIDSENPGI